MTHIAANFQGLLECYCPKGCGFYFLMGFSADEVLVRYPAKGAYRVRNPHQPPMGAPAGRYMLSFVRNPTDARTVPHVNAPPGHLSVTLGGAEGATAQVVRAELPRRKQLSSGTQIAVAARRSPEKRREADPTEAAEPEDESVRRARSEAAIRGLALDVKLREGRVARAGAVTDDLVDALQLNQFYRHEVQDLTHDTTTLSGQHFEMMGKTVKLIEHLQESVGRHIDLSKAQLEKLATPPAPPDYNPSIVAGLNMIRDLGVAFAQRRGRRRKKRPLPAASTATSQVHEQVTSTASAATAQTSEPSASPSASSPTEVPTPSGASTQAKPDSIPAAMIDAVLDTLRAAKVPGTNPDRSPPRVAPVPAVAPTEPTPGTPAQPNARAPLLDRETTEEVAAVLSELLRRKKSEGKGPR